MFKTVANRIRATTVRKFTRRCSTEAKDDAKEFSFLAAGGGIGAVSFASMFFYEAYDKEDSLAEKTGWFLITIPLGVVSGGIVGTFGGFLAYGASRCTPCLLGMGMIATGITLVSYSKSNTRSRY